MNKCYYEIQGYTVCFYDCFHEIYSSKDFGTEEALEYFLNLLYNDDFDNIKMTETRFLVDW